MQIIKRNVFTLFNFLNVMITLLLFAVGAYSNMFFITIVILNVVIGTAQELKAKKLVDELSILNQPKVTVLRDGKETTVAVEEVVKGDQMVLESGCQICNDGVVTSGRMEVDESMLTGESDAIEKKAGDPLFSGSFVIAGRCTAEVTHTGEENYAMQLTTQAKQEKRIESELQGSMKKVTRWTSLFIVPLGILLFLEATVLRQATISSAVVSSAAALLGMLPKGLVLLISVSLAMGVIRLSKMRILVQNIYALESLAHVDVLCLDKTGTLTNGEMKVQEKILCSGIPAAWGSELMDAYLLSSEDKNGTIRALREGFQPAVTAWKPVHQIPFSSVRKWGAVSFEGKGTIFLGAPERIFHGLPTEAETQMENGCRVIALGYSKEQWTEEDHLPEDLTPIYLVSLLDQIRKNASQTLAYFKREGVEVKVISGDHEKTVAAVAKRAGLEKWNNTVDMSKLPEHMDFEQLCSQYTVFARTTPEQKRELVRAMKRQGHKVAMTGDGVNDLLALKEADCSIAVSEGSDASRQIAQIVLLDSDFSYLPQVVLEGRKVVNNVTRTAGVFFIKTIYSVLVSIFCLIANVPFPFIPIQITLVDAFVEAYPSFLTIFESDTRQIKGKFLPTVFKRALPFALLVTAEIVVLSLTQPFGAAQTRILMYLLLIVISMSAVVKSCIPFDKLRTFICTTMAAGVCMALVILPGLFLGVH